MESQALIEALRKRQPELKATPRNKVLGALADAANSVDQFASAPFGYDNPPGRLVSALLGVPSVGKTLDRMSYGESLGTGSGMTWKPKPETVEAALIAAPLAVSAAPTVARGAVNTAKFVAPKVGQMAEDYAVKTGAILPATVWHGSPHKFDKFDASKIGTGEGAQAYGHGLYLAESPEVGADYANVLASPRNRVSDKRGVYIEPSPMGGGKYMLATKSEVGQPRGLADDATQFIYPDKEFPNLASAMKFARQKGFLSRDERPRLTAIGEDKKYVPVSKASDVAEPEYTQFIASDPGYLYKVDLPDEAIAKMLDWDKPLSEQAPEVQQALGKFGFSVDKQELSQFDDALLAALEGTGSTTLPKQPLNPSGEAVLQKLFQQERKRIGANQGASVYQAAVSDLLKQQGIPGIRYLDGGSRRTGQGTSNFVVFPGNEDLLTILERNGQTVPTPATVEALRKKRP